MGKMTKIDRVEQVFCDEGQLDQQNLQIFTNEWKIFFQFFKFFKFYQVLQALIYGRMCREEMMAVQGHILSRF